MSKDLDVRVEPFRLKEGKYVAAFVAFPKVYAVADTADSAVDRLGVFFDRIMQHYGRRFVFSTGQVDVEKALAACESDLRAAGWGN